MAVDEVDFKDFAQKVMARVTPEKPPLLERLRLSLSEMFLYQRTAMLSSLATAAVVLLVARAAAAARPGAAGLRRRAHDGAGGAHLRGRPVAPVVMETDDGSSIIWMVDAGQRSQAHERRAGDSSRGDESQSDELELDGAAAGLP